jgi:SAM-dependent methyltransferase
MLSLTLGKLFGRAPPAPQAEAGSGPQRGAAAPGAASKKGAPSDWPAARLALTDQLWGPGFITPGGELETMRLVRSLQLSSAGTLLLVGAGAGGAVSVVVRNTGAYVNGFESDLSLVAAAQSLAKRANLGRKATIKAWNPRKPDFPPKSHNYVLAMDPLHGAPADPVLHSLAEAVRPGGHLVMTELTAPAQLDPADRTVRRWAKLEKRDPEAVVPAAAVGKALKRIGLDVRIAEDTSQRELDQAMTGWRDLVRDLGDNKPSPMTAAFMVAEAELWLLRRKLMQEGKLKTMRWHAIKRVQIV